MDSKKEKLLKNETLKKDENLLRKGAKRGGKEKGEKNISLARAKE